MLVNDVDDLQAIDTNLSGHYALGRDIDAAATATWNIGDGFVPIGAVRSEFTGSLDGQGHVIDGLFIDRPGQDHVGLFGVNAGNLHDLGLSGVKVSGFGPVGALAGHNGGSISNAYSSGAVSGAQFVGWLVGENDGSMSFVYSTASVTAGDTALDIGGLVGLNFRAGGITDAYSSGTVTVGAGSFVVHLTGFDVRGHQNVAGLAGRSAGTIDDVTVAGIASIDATGSSVGSTVGLNSGSVTNATASGQVLWDGHAVEAVVGSQRGLVGAGSGTVASSSFTGDVYEAPVPPPPGPQTGFVLDPNLIRFLMLGQGDLGAPGAPGDALADGTGGGGSYQTDILGAGYGLGGVGPTGLEGLNPAAGGGAQGGYDGSLCVEQFLQNMWAQNQCQ